MKLQIQILVENTTPVPGLIGEYGFSTLVSADDKKILFDTGSADAVLKNSKALGINLSALDALVISHGHFDHTGAVLKVAEMNPGLNVYGHPAMFEPHYVERAPGSLYPVGAGFSESELRLKGANFKAIGSFTEIMPNIFFCGEIPRSNDFEDAGAGFRTEVDGQFREDHIADDSALAIRLADGLVIISGCAHAGMINTLSYCMEQTNCHKILAFIGGTHLAMASETRIKKTIEALKAMDIKTIAVAHCTGFNPAAMMRQSLGSKLVKAETGMMFKY
ncbi:MAG: MBL fold metallo-hydrolase [Syntrophomonadaceae bacterium]|jgi:7,8-dihydropterin-6-yl-methyl-4-(beta-D-ribofuranosyl)aminobenzene 5'-phosphate synthase|nr:MBL fold metallo-hydrolase [Syntrophomonadaceae bacterium]